MTYKREEILSSPNLELLFKRKIPITTGKKNKRGARGPLEDEISALKRPKMSTDNAPCRKEVEEVEEVDTTKEPNLQTLLISIQRTTENSGIGLVN